MAESYIQNLIAERIGGNKFGKDTVLYKFEKIKRARRAAVEAHPDVAVIDLGVGEPDAMADEGVVATLAKEAANWENRGYTDNGREPFMRAAAEYMNNVYGVEGIDPETEVLHSIGSKPALAMIPQAFINPGDVALVTVPGYGVLANMTKWLGGEVYNLPLLESNKFLPDFDSIPEDILKRAKLLYINYPNNPTGAIMEREDLERIAPVCIKHDLLVISDEIYAELTYGGKNHVSIASVEGMKERTVVLNGFAKSFSMTGWRLGYAAGPKELMKVINKVHAYIIMCTPTMSQYGAIEALRDDDLCDSDVGAMREAYDERRQYLVKALNNMGLTCFEPRGAFYVFPSIAVTGLTSQEFCERLLHEASVAVVPGDAFGESGEGHVRISYAYSMEQLQTAMEKIREFLQKNGWLKA